jgi:hypothetical protein
MTLKWFPKKQAGVSEKTGRGFGTACESGILAAQIADFGRSPNTRHAANARLRPTSCPVFLGEDVIFPYTHK